MLVQVPFFYHVLERHATGKLFTPNLRFTEDVAIFHADSYHPDNADAVGRIHCDQMGSNKKSGESPSHIIARIEGGLYSSLATLHPMRSDAGRLTLFDMDCFTTAHFTPYNYFHELAGRVARFMPKQVGQGDDYSTLLRTEHVEDIASLDPLLGFALHEVHPGLLKNNPDSAPHKHNPLSASAAYLSPESIRPEALFDSNRIRAQRAIGRHIKTLKIPEIPGLAMLRKLPGIGGYKITPIKATALIRIEPAFFDYDDPGSPAAALWLDKPFFSTLDELEQSIESMIEKMVDHGTDSSLIQIIRVADYDEAARALVNQHNQSLQPDPLKVAQ